MSYEDPGAPTALYRLYDVPGLLLYVGIAVDPVNRLKQHASQPWSFAISRQVVEWHPTRRAAAAAETAAIRTEGPVWNTSQADPARKHEVRMALWHADRHIRDLYSGRGWGEVTAEERQAAYETRNRELCEFAGMVPSPARAAYAARMDHFIHCYGCEYPQRCETGDALTDAYHAARDAERFTSPDPIWGGA